MHHGCSRAFRRTKDVILSREQGMQAGPMPVAVFVGYVMPQVSDITGYGDGGDGINQPVNVRRLFNRAEARLTFAQYSLKHPNLSDVRITQIQPRWDHRKRLA
jgi:hypothetical protein